MVILTLKQIPENIGKFEKGIHNNNAKNLFEYAKESNLVLTNVLYKHSVAYPTTLTSPKRVQEHLTYDGTVCHNPYRNQIDYIICKNIHKAELQDSRLYSGTSTPTDRNLVKAVTKIECWKMGQQFKLNSLNQRDLLSTS